MYMMHGLVLTLDCDAYDAWISTNLLNTQYPHRLIHVNVSSYVYYRVFMFTKAMHGEDHPIYMCFGHHTRDMTKSPQHIWKVRIAKQYQFGPLMVKII